MIRKVCKQSGWRGGGTIRRGGRGRPLGTSSIRSRDNIPRVPAMTSLGATSLPTIFRPYTRPNPTSGKNARHLLTANCFVPSVCIFLGTSCVQSAGKGRLLERGKKLLMLVAFFNVRMCPLSSPPARCCPFRLCVRHRSAGSQLGCQAGGR